MSKIKTIKTAPVTKYEVEIDGCIETFDSKSEAERRLKEVEQIKESRAKDFLIAEFIFDYEWVGAYGKNSLVAPGTKIYGNYSVGRDDDLPIDGILSSSVSDLDWAPCRFELPDKFGVLIAGILDKGYLVEFEKCKNGDTNCYIKRSRGDQNSWVGFGIKEKDYYATGYIMQLALKEAAWELAKFLHKDLTTAAK